MMFPDYIIRKPLKHPFFKVKQFGLYNPNCISTNSKHVCNMDSHFSLGTILIFLTLILLFLSHCYMFLVKNRVFGLLDQIAPKLPQKIRKNSRTVTPLEETSMGLRPSKFKIPSFRPIFNFFNFSYSQKNLKKFALVLFDF